MALNWLLVKRVDPACVFSQVFTPSLAVLKATFSKDPSAATVFHLGPAGQHAPGHMGLSQGHHVSAQAVRLRVPAPTPKH